MRQGNEVGHSWTPLLNQAEKIDRTQRSFATKAQDDKNGLCHSKPSEESSS